MGKIGGLIITRKQGQSIMIEDVEVIVEMTSQGRCKLRIKADSAVSVKRSELVEKDKDKDEGK